jgi:hypothetical protein
MENIELQYSNNGFLMQGIHNGQYLDKNEISKVIFNALEGETLPPEASSPELLGNILHNFSEGWLKPIQSVLGRKGINFTVKGDSPQYNLRENTKMTNEQLRMQMLSGIITESEYKSKLEENKTPKNKKSLNENFVGMGAINSPFAKRKKESYEDAFEHFLSERYQIKPNRERDDIKDLEEDKDPDVYESETNEGFVGNFLKKIAQSTGVINDTLTIIDLARKDEEGGAEKAVQMLIDKHGMSEEEALKTVTHVYEKFKPWIELTQRNN